jgi:ribosomal protein S18 acetylase RimI-like enzyme
MPICWAAAASSEVRSDSSSLAFQTYGKNASLGPQYASLLSWPLIRDLPCMITFRNKVESRDRAAVRRLVQATGFFSEEEVAIAEELVVASEKGATESGYHFLFADKAIGANEPATSVGFACFGPIPGSKIGFDLYWIVVDPNVQGEGLGRKLLSQAEEAVGASGGRQLYADTSGREQYLPTRRFYERCGYTLVATLENFYDEGDDKTIFSKRLIENP